MKITSRQTGRDIFSEWFLKLKDRKAKQHVERRLSYIEQGNFGDHKFCQDGVWELRRDVGPGYRIYYGLSGTTIVMLLCGGDKSSQSRDIDRACTYWKQFKREKEDAIEKPR